MSASSTPRGRNITGAEWLTCQDASKMLKKALASKRASDRVCRLYVATVWDWVLRGYQKRQKRLWLGRAAALAEWGDTGVLPEAIQPPAARTSVYLDENARTAVRSTIVTMNQPPIEEHKLRPFQAAMFRELFGNPFRPVKLNRSWLTSDVLALARGIYDEKAFDRMPILADALQDAGCANEAVLNHCRDASATHVRGCWVVDLLLGKK